MAEEISWDDASVRGALDRLAELAAVQGVAFHPTAELLWQIASSRRKTSGLPAVDAARLAVMEGVDEALHEYAALAPGYPGAEARLRHALLLKRLGKLDDARRILKDLLDGGKLAPAHYRRAQAQWLDRARRELG